MKVEIIKEQMVSSCCSLEWLGGWAQVKGSAAVCSQQVRVCSVRQQQPDAGSVAADTGIVEGGVSPGVRVHLRTTKQQLLHTACVTSAGSQVISFVQSRVSQLDCDLRLVLACDWAVEDVPFKPNHDAVTCQQFTCLPGMWLVFFWAFHKFRINIYAKKKMKLKR